MGLHDDSGNIYEMLQYTFFNNTDLGSWEKMIDGMVNVSQRGLSSSKKSAEFMYSKEKKSFLTIFHVIGSGKRPNYCKLRLKKSLCYRSDISFEKY
jgi:hypothetical protein